MVNAAGEDFFNQQVDAPIAYGPYTVQLKALARQIRAGKASYEGGYYAGLPAAPFFQPGFARRDNLSVEW